METKRAFVTGITGQDGSYLAELLLEKGYEVHGLVRRLSVPNRINIENIVDNITLHEGDLHDQISLNQILREISPEEVYCLAAQSFVGTSWTQPVLTGDITGLGAIRMLEAVRAECPDARVYQAGSSEMFGKVTSHYQNEHTPFHPRSPYGCAKVFAHHLAVNYRESYNMFIVNGILFNHESPRRGIEFVSKKIARGAARIAKRIQKPPLRLGNLSALRDWGYAPEYVEAMWTMLQQKEPDDYVIATGEAHTVHEFVKLAFLEAGIEDIELNWKTYIEANTRENVRPAEVHTLCGDASKAKHNLNWSPKTTFKDLVKIMVQHELEGN